MLLPRLLAYIYSRNSNFIRRDINSRVEERSDTNKLFAPPHIGSFRWGHAMLGDPTSVYYTVCPSKFVEWIRMIRLKRVNYGFLLNLSIHHITKFFLFRYFMIHIIGWFFLFYSKKISCGAVPCAWCKTRACMWFTTNPFPHEIKLVATAVHLVLDPVPSST